MKVLLINNPSFTSYTTLALTPHNEQTGLCVVTHCICLYKYLATNTKMCVAYVWLCI